MPTNGFSIKPLKVRKQRRIEQIVSELLGFLVLGTWETSMKKRATCGATASSQGAAMLSKSTVHSCQGRDLLAPADMSKGTTS